MCDLGALRVIVGLLDSLNGIFWSSFRDKIVGFFCLCCFGLFVFRLCCFFFFKQKTAYEVRISDWSSDVCSSDLAGSLIGLLTYMASDAQLRDLTFWSMGSLAGASWPLLAFLAPWTLLWSAWLMRQWRAMNALLLGEREAQHLGFALVTVRYKLVLATALIVGPLVAATGGIGFVGLVVPHLVRMTLGADHRWLLPASMLAGALALTLADWLARILVIPAELPIGTVTSLGGGTFFLCLLARGRRF